MSPATTGRPPQLVAASERPLRLAGAPTSIAAFGIARITGVPAGSLDSK